MNIRIATLLAAAALSITACGADAGEPSGQGLSSSNADMLIVPRAGNSSDSDADAKPSKWSRGGASGAAMPMGRPADKAKPMGMPAPGGSGAAGRADQGDAAVPDLDPGLDAG